MIINFSNSAFRERLSAVPMCHGSIFIIQCINIAGPAAANNWMRMLNDDVDEPARVLEPAVNMRGRCVIRRRTV